MFRRGAYAGVLKVVAAYCVEDEATLVAQCNELSRALSALSLCVVGSFLPFFPLLSFSIFLVNAARKEGI
jgi:hypothetical protein